MIRNRLACCTRQGNLLQCALQNVASALIYGKQTMFKKSFLATCFCCILNAWHNLVLDLLLFYLLSLYLNLYCNLLITSYLRKKIDQSFLSWLRIIQTDGGFYRNFISLSSSPPPTLCVCVCIYSEILLLYTKTAFTVIWGNF